MRLVFSLEANEDRLYFKKHEPRTAEKLKRLIVNIMASPFTGLGKPESLKHGLSGYWSRRITREHRLVYKVEEDAIFIASCRCHY